MSGFLAAVAATFVFVGLKSFQQRNVAFDHYILIMPTSIGLALTEYLVIGYMALEAFNGGFTWAYFGKASLLGLAAGSGSLLATRLHGKYLGRGASTTTLAQGTSEVRR